MNGDKLTLKSEIRRYGDLVAFKVEGQHFAFHPQRVEAALVSPEIFSLMVPVSFASSDKPEVADMDIASPTSQALSEALAELKHWEGPDLDLSHLQMPSDSPRQDRSVTVNVTQICNLHCHYCAAGGDGTYGDPVRQISIDKTIPQIQFITRNLKSGDSFRLTLLGGEPLLYPTAVKALILDVSERAKKQGFTCKINIITNATLVTADLAQFFAEYSVFVTVSMDGAPEVNDLARPQKNGSSSSGATLQGIKLLLEHKVPVLIHSVFTKTHTDVLGTYLYFSKMPVRMEFTLDIAEKNQSIVDQFCLSFAQAANQAWKSGGEVELRRISYFDAQFDLFDQQKRIENHCGVGKNLLSLDSKNQIFSCPLEVGNPKEKLGQDTDLQSAFFEEYSKPLIELNNCQTCWARYSCGGGCMHSHKLMTGQKHKKNPAYCTRTRYLLSLSIMYYLMARQENAE